MKQGIKNCDPYKKKDCWRNKAKAAAEPRRSICVIARRKKPSHQGGAQGGEESNTGADQRKCLPCMESESAGCLLSPLLTGMDIYCDKSGNKRLRKEVLKVIDKPEGKADEVGLKRRAEGRGCYHLLDEAEQLADDQETCDGTDRADDMVILY